MEKRKIFLIDKKYQLRITISIILITSLIATILLGINISFTAGNNKSLAETIEINKKMIDTFTTIGRAEKFYIDQLQAVKDKKTREDLISGGHSHFQALGNMKKKLTDIEKSTLAMKKVIDYNYIMLMIAFIFIIAQGTVLYFFTVKRTHRFFGPIYVLSNYLNDVIEGKEPENRALRQNDVLVEFSELVYKAMDVLKNKK